MNWKMVLGLFILAVAGVTAWQAHLYLDVRTIAVNGVVEGKGWGILARLWPFAILAAIIVGVAGNGLTAYLLGLAHYADESERVKEAERAQAEAERERDQAFASEQQAREIARANLDRERATVEQFRQQLLEHQGKLVAWEAQLKEREARATTEVARAQANEARAERRKQNATAAFHRKSKKLKTVGGG